MAVGLSLWSCASNKSEYEKVVSEWQGKEIMLPDVMTDFLTGDTIDLPGADFTILTYVDSIGCTGCKMKLPLWKEFLNSIDSINESEVRFLMVVNPAGLEELEYLLKRDDFDYPISLDEGNKVSGANSFPEKTVLQTFLLDRNRKVTAIGNPVYSSEIGKLYKAIIRGEMSVSATSGDIISVGESRVSLGTLHPGEAQSREIVFSNHGNDTIRIKKVLSSCECTELSLPQRYISPQSELKVVLKFAGDTIAGDFERTVHVYYSDFEYPTVITVSGNIIH